MATTDDSLGGLCERCASCGTETLHRVSIQMRTSDPEAGSFSRDPYRVTECHRCGERSSRPLDRY